MDVIFTWPWVKNNFKRRAILIVAVLVAAFLTVWPRHYEARAQLLPDDAGAGLAGLLTSASGGGGGLLSLGGLIGNHQSIESDLTIARSEAVLLDVVHRMRERGLFKGQNEEQAERSVRHGSDMEAVRGSILRITATDKDPVFAKGIVASYVDAIRARLAAISREQSTQKKAIALNRMNDAATELARAQAALDRFRVVNRLGAPEAQLGAAVTLVTQLQSQLHAQEAELQASRKFATADNIQIQASEAKVAGLRDQIRSAEMAANSNPGPNIGELTPVITEYENLYRNEKYAEAEYEIYTRYLDTVVAEELSANINMDLIEPPFVDPERRFNGAWLGMMALIVVSGLVAEFYLVSVRASLPRPTSLNA